MAPGSSLGLAVVEFAVSTAFFSLGDSLSTSLFHTSVCKFCGVCGASCRDIVQRKWNWSFAVAAPTQEIIRIRMEAYDHAVLDQSAAEIVDTAKRTNSPRSGAGRSPHLRHHRLSVHRLSCRPRRAQSPPSSAPADTSSFNSPEASISHTMSQPPISSPSTQS
jgi:hypothetical protein